jgi:RimJ/RimL family protein N-acetyltransferase
LEDSAPLAAIWADPDVTRYMGGPRNEAQVRMSLVEDAGAPVQPDYDLHPVIEKATGLIVGHCGLLEKEVDGTGEIELVYVLAPTAWGKGYATEAGRALMGDAFTRLGLRRLIALIDPENADSERVALKLGMHHDKDTLRPGGKRMRVYVAVGEPEA